jgi:hypothetical protein
MKDKRTVLKVKDDRGAGRREDPLQQSGFDAFSGRFSDSSYLTILGIAII